MLSNAIAFAGCIVLHAFEDAPVGRTFTACPSETLQDRADD